jgi:molybdenum cofactor cytidylyltransferase
MQEPRQSLAGLVLAAGGSSRLGYPKQLLIWRGKPLIQYAVEQSLAVCGAGVVVVTGADSTDIATILQVQNVELVANPEWQAGVATSLRAGINALQSRPLGGVLITLCDQPLVKTHDLARLADIWQAAPHLPAAARYGNVVGVPAIFPVGYFDQLAGLEGDAGARTLLRANSTCRIMDMPDAALDIDTAEDIERLRRYDR